MYIIAFKTQHIYLRKYILVSQFSSQLALLIFCL